MILRGMSDWSLAELEDINWDVFCQNDDHIVPHQVSGFSGGSPHPCDSEKKPWHKGKNDESASGTETVLLEEEVYCSHAENGTLSAVETIASHKLTNAVPVLCNLERTARDGGTLGGCINDSSRDNTTTRNSRVCQGYSSQGTAFSINDSTLNGVLSDATHFFIPESQQDREYDNAYYNWHDHGNFEDVDMMFRNLDSAFGPGKTGTSDELSWFSSPSNTFHGSEIACEPGFQSLSSDLSMIHSQVEPCKAEAAAKQKSCYEGNTMKVQGGSQISNEYMLNENGSTDSKSQQRSRDKEIRRSTGEMSDFAAAEVYYDSQVSLRRHFMGCSSSDVQNLDSTQLEFDLPAHGVDPFSQMTSAVEFDKTNRPSSSYKISDRTVRHPSQCLERFPDQSYIASEDNIKNLYRVQLAATLTAAHPLQQPTGSKSLVRKDLNEIKDYASVENVALELPVMEIDDPRAHVISGAMPASSDNTSRVTSFQQLKQVTHQLDVRTKLCIRDSLYRLARSAGQRHTFDSPNCSEGAIHVKRIQGFEASKRVGEFIHAETNTNPIDRSIAHLLFHKPPIAVRPI